MRMNEAPREILPGAGRFTSREVRERLDWLKAEREDYDLRGSEIGPLHRKTMLEKWDERYGEEYDLLDALYDDELRGYFAPDEYIITLIHEDHIDDTEAELDGYTSIEFGDHTYYARRGELTW